MLLEQDFWVFGVLAVGSMETSDTVVGLEGCNNNVDCPRLEGKGKEGCLELEWREEGVEMT